MALTEQLIYAITQEAKNKFLFEAARDGRAEEIPILIEHGANPLKSFAVGFSTSNTLQIAARYGRLGVIKELLKMKDVKDNAHAKDNDALSWAAYNGYHEVVKELLKIDTVKVNAHVDNYWILRKAAARGHHEVVKELLKIKDVKDNAHVFNNQTLRKAAENHHFEIVNLLLSLDVVLNSLTPELKNILHEQGFYTWQRRCIILAIRAMHMGGLPFEIMLPILKELYPEFSDETFGRQLTFVDNLPKDMGQFMHALAVENNIERLNHLLQEGFSSELTTDTEKLLENKGYALDQNQNGQLVFSNFNKSRIICEENDDMIIDHDVNNYCSII